MTDMTTSDISGEDAPDLNADPGEPQEIRGLMRRILVDHAISLDRVYLDLADYIGDIIEERPSAAQIYLRLALRAQSNCRSALETVVRSDRIDEAAAARAAAAAAASPSRPAIAAVPAKSARRPRAHIPAPAHAQAAH